MYIKNRRNSCKIKAFGLCQTLCLNESFWLRNRLLIMINHLIMINILQIKIMKRTILFLFFGLTFIQAKSQAFVLKENTLFPASYSTSDVGDYDNDGDIDIIISGGTTGWSNSEKYTKIFDNDGKGNFTENTKNTITGLVNSSVAWGDFNNDGLLDFILCGNDYYPSGSENAGYDRCSTNIYKNNGNGSFEDINAQITGLNRGHVSWADLDNDGYLDIVINGSTGGGRPQLKTKIYRNNKNSTYTEMPTTIIGTSGGESRCFDFNNDGLLDILVSGYYKDSIINAVSSQMVAITKVYVNLGNFSFTPISYSFSRAGRNQISDFNNDGYKDILLVDWGRKNIFIYTNDTKGSFIKTTYDFQIIPLNNELIVGDFNNDGLNDIFMSGVRPDTNEHNAKLYLNNGDMTFRESDFAFPSVFAGTSNCADFNNDGKVDLFYTGGTTGYGDDPIAKLYINNMSNTATLDTKYSNIKIYPNPCKDNIYINSNERLDEISIYKLDGGLVLQKHLNNENKINVSTLLKGIYSIKVITETGVFQQKLIKE